MVSARTFVIGIVVVIILAAAAYLLTLPQQPPIAEKPITIGFTASLSGGFAVEGRRQLEGIILWAEDVNKTGGIFVKDQNKRFFVKLVYYDDESKKDSVIRLYEKLINEDKVDFLISPYSSTLALTSAGVSEKYRMVNVVTGAASDAIFAQGFKYVVQVYTPASLYLASTIDLLIQTDPAAKRIAIIFKDDAFAKSVAAGTKEYAASKGLEVVAYEMYPADATDLSPVLTKVKALAPDAIIGGGHLKDGILLIRQAKELDVNAKLFSLLVAPPEPDFYRDLGKAAEYVMGPSQWEPSLKYTVNYGPSVGEFVKRYQERWGITPTYHSAGGYAAGLLLQAAIEKAGTLNREAVRAAFNQLDLTIFFGRFKVDPATGKQVAHSMVLIQWQDGKRVVVFPREAAEAPARYPAPPWKQRG